MNFTDGILDQKTYRLGLHVCVAWIRDVVALKCKIAHMATDADGGSTRLSPIAYDMISDDAVPVWGHANSLIMEEDSIGCVVANLIILDKVVCIFMSDGNTKAPIVFQHVLFKDPITNPPAQKEAIGSIVARDVV